MSSSLPEGSSSPPPSPSSFSSLDSGKLGAQSKRPPSVSQAEQLLKTMRLEDTSNSDYELTETQDDQNIESAVLTLKKQRLDEYNQPVYIAPMAKANLQAPNDTLFPLMEKVNKFLADDSQVMLILGDSGAGKSTFNRHLEHELWQVYQSGGRIPLFINLPALERPEKDLVAEQLRTHDFTDDQIRDVKLRRQFMLICDGYDESQLTSNLHTTNLLNRSGQWDAKLLITCRTQYLGPDYRIRFAPTATNQYYRIANDLFMEAVISPFSKEQIEDYVERYIPLEPRTWVKEDYMEKLETIPNLMDLVKNPFLLTLCLEALPNDVQGKTNISQLRVTRVQLYDTFVGHWLGVNKRRLQEHRLDEGKHLAFEGLLEDGFESNGIRFQQDLAAAIFQEQEGRPVVVYTQRRDGTSWKAAFFGPEPDIFLLRGVSLLSRVGIQYRFVHRSILEYFYSRAIWRPADSNDEFAPHSLSDTSNVSDHPLSQRNLIVEPSIIQFLAERVQLDPGFKRQLHALIEQSKTDDRTACAATNAITILVKAGVRFNGADLRGICIPGADLSGGQFDSAQLQEADLTGVNLTRSWIRQADLSKARMERVDFGELPFLEEGFKVRSIAYSPNKESFAAGLDFGHINIYDSTTWTATRTLRGHGGTVTGIAYSPSGEQLVSGSHDFTVRLWNCKTGTLDLTLVGHTKEVNAVAFSPSSSQIASASFDGTVRLWNSQTGAALAVLQGHTDWAFSVAYSPDGQSVVFGGFDGPIRIFDTHSEQMGLILDNKDESVFCVAYSPDCKWIITGDMGGNLRLWESITGKSGKQWKGHVNSVCAVSFSPNGLWIASSSGDCTVKLWDAHAGTLISVFAGHSALVTCVAFSLDSLQLASGSEDGTVRLWDVTTTGAGLDLNNTQSDPIKKVAFPSDGRCLISGSNSGALRQYDALTGEPGRSFQCGSLQADVVAISPDGRRIATAGYSEVIKIWSVETGVAEFALQGHMKCIKTLAFSPDGQWIASGGWSETVRLWNVSSVSPGLVFVGHSDDVLSVAFSTCGRQLISGSRDGTIRVWEVATGNSRWIVTVCNNDSVWLWNLVVRDAVQKWKCALVIREFLRGVASIAWRPNALEFVTGSRDGRLQAWRLVGGQDDGFSARLVWSYGHTAFVATDAVMVDTVGLSATNRRLLKQRGAKDGSLSSDDTLDESQGVSSDENLDQSNAE
ncbi:WD_REPEATS_REGION domain-containing protein [Haplosporangium gracile]|nr:WD_REPEATS_REGION domain-containing protein [Haplosporangium gracile]